MYSIIEIQTNTKIFSQIQDWWVKETLTFFKETQEFSSYNWMEKDFQNPWHFNIKQKRKRDVIHLTEKSKEKREERKSIHI